MDARIFASSLCPVHVQCTKSITLGILSCTVSIEEIMACSSAVVIFIYGTCHKYHTHIGQILRNFIAA